MEGEFRRKFIFGDLTNYRGSRPSCKVYKLKEMDDGASLILTSMLPLCCIVESPIAPHISVVASVFVASCFIDDMSLARRDDGR